MKLLHGWILMIIVGIICLPIGMSLGADFINVGNNEYSSMLFYLGFCFIIIGVVLTSYQVYKDYYWNPKNGLTPDDE